MKGLTVTRETGKREAYEFRFNVLSQEAATLAESS